jgi:integrase
MGRKTVYNANITKEWDGYEENGSRVEVLKENKELVKSFIAYCKANDRSPQTIAQYEQWLKVFFCWNCRDNGNKFFIDMDITDFMFYIGHLRELDESPRRIASLKSVLNSMSKMIQRMYRAKYPSFRNQVCDLEPVYIEPVREKTVLSTKQVDDILNTLVENGDYQIACYLSLVCASGARKGEILQMKKDWFGPNGNTVFDGYMYLTPEVRAKGRGKRGKRLSKYVIKSMFDRYYDLWMQERERLGITSEFLFVTKEKGEYVQAKVSTANSFARKISQISDEDFYTHSGRHYFCTMLKSMNLPDEVIMQIIGWSSNMVSVYDDTPPEERLQKFFSGFLAEKGK